MKGEGAGDSTSLSFVLQLLRPSLDVNTGDDGGMCGEGVAEIQ